MSENKRTYLNALSEISSDLSPEQQQAVQQYGELFVKAQNDELESDVLADAFVLLLTEHHIPVQIFMQIQSFDMAFGFTSFEE